MGNKQMNPRDAELAVIGCILLGAKTDLRASDFGTPDLRLAYEAVERMTGEKSPLSSLS